MSDYVQTIDFSAKDSLPTGDPNKVIRGSDFDMEFAALASAVATKYDSTDIGVNVQGYDSYTAKYNDATANFSGALQKSGSNVLTAANLGVTVQGYDADTAKIDTQQSWTAQQVPKNGTLTYAAPISWDCATNGQVVSVTLNGSTSINGPTNVLENASYVLVVKQDATGSRTLTWASAYKFANGTDPVVSTAANAVDIFTFIGGAGNVLYCIGQARNLS